MRKEQHARGRALVIGGSMAGLLAARALSEHFEQVVILERDRFPDSPEHRRGTPQTRHAHGLLASGLQVLEELFPGISNELVKKGASTCDPVANGLWVFEGAPMKKAPSGTIGMIASRPLLEHTIRNRVFGLSNVQVEQECSVRGLEVEGDVVRGVQTSEGVIVGDLVVDASGRGSVAYRWLADMGFEAAREDTVKIDITYTTRIFKRSENDLGGDGFVVISPQIGNNNSGVMIAQEGGFWMATLVGRGGHRVPEDLAGFISSAKELQSRHIYDVVRQAEPIGEAVAMRYPASVRRSI